MNLLGSRNAAAEAPGASGRATGRPLLLGLVENGRQRDDNHGRPVICRLGELRPHPSYSHHRLTVPVSKLSALAEQGDLAFREPLVITRESIVIDGYARIDLARRQGRPTLPCIEYELTEEESLLWLLQRHRRSNGLNDFCRILLALELETCFREKALSNQRLGGQSKASSRLTEAERVDVRKQIAAAAAVSVGNVTKVKQLVGTAHPKVLEALRNGETSIHRAWKWSTESPDQQIEAFRTYRNKKGVNKAIRDLISRHGPRNLPTAPDAGSLVRRLSGLSSGECSSVSVAVIRVQGKMIFVTEELIQSLPPYQESIPTCTTDNP
jgi:hypothetical protein